MKRAMALLAMLDADDAVPSTPENVVDLAARRQGR